MSLAFVRGIQRWPVNSPHKGPVTRKMLLFDDVTINTDGIVSRNRTFVSIKCQDRHLIRDSLVPSRHTAPKIICELNRGTEGSDIIENLRFEDIARVLDHVSTYRYWLFVVWLDKNYIVGFRVWVSMGLVDIQWDRLWVWFANTHTHTHIYIYIYIIHNDKCFVVFRV